MLEHLTDKIETAHDSYRFWFKFFNGVMSAAEEYFDLDADDGEIQDGAPFRNGDTWNQKYGPM